MLDTKTGSNVSTMLYEKATYTARYLRFKSDHPQYVKRIIVPGLVHRAKVIRQEKNVFNREI